MRTVSPVSLYSIDKANLKCTVLNLYLVISKYILYIYISKYLYRWFSIFMLLTSLNCAFLDTLLSVLSSVLINTGQAHSEISFVVDNFFISFHCTWRQQQLQQYQICSTNLCHYNTSFILKLNAIPIWPHWNKANKVHRKQAHWIPCFTNFANLVNRVRASQNTDWLVSNSLFYPIDAVFYSNTYPKRINSSQCYELTRRCSHLP